jgi:elongation factor Ts
MSVTPTCRHIHAYVHQGRIGVLIEFGTETGVIADTADFHQFARDIAMHVAAQNPPDIASLLDQPFVKDPANSIRNVISQFCGSARERVTITRFVRWDQEWPSPPEIPAPPRAPAVIMQFKKT